jgi:hypothetical protein
LSDINPKDLRQAIRNMKQGDSLSRLLKTELSKIDWFVLNNLNWLRNSIRKMKRHQPIYKILKDELSPLGYWRLKARGNPKAGFRKGFGKHKGDS